MEKEVPLEWVQHLWGIVAAEPRWLTIVGLYCDLAGAVIIAITAWFRLSFPGVTGVSMSGGLIYTGDIEEPSRPLWWRRGFVIAGGILLAGGFALQIYANHLQLELR